MKTALIIVATLLVGFLALGAYGTYANVQPSHASSERDAVCSNAEIARIEQRSREEAVRRLCETQTAALAASPEMLQLVIKQRNVDAAALRRELQSTDAVLAMVESCTRELLARTWPVPYEKMLKDFNASVGAAAAK